MPVNLDDKLIDPHAPQYAKMMQRLQGNILKGHGRDHTVHIFLCFTASTPDLKTKFKSLCLKILTSAARQRDESEQFKQFGIPGGIFGNVFLTKSGLEKLGLAAAQIAVLNDLYFTDGMKARGSDFNDPTVSTWDQGYQNPAIDGMLLLADDDEQFLLRRAREVINDVSEFADIIQVERGNALRNEEGEGIEHFGYVDGRSQPIYFQTDLPDEGGTNLWDPSEPLKRVLLPDPMAAQEDSFGSYFVFRKLEQNVRGFKVREQDVADALGLTGDDRERAGAMAVGRFEDGTPLALSMTDGFVPKKENNFQYDIDPDGLKCPFHAHIRKTNPRGDIRRKLVPAGNDEALERRHRITRRGITYGTRTQHPDEDQLLDELPSKDVGLLFMCFQTSIDDQFAFMQSAWVNSDRFLLPGTGEDPLIAQSPPGPSPAPQQWNPLYGTSGPTVALDFGHFVTMKGGEFFFAPSIPFFNHL